MKKMRLFYMGERLKDIYPHATKWEVIKYKLRMAFKRFMRLCAIALILYGVFIAGGHFNPTFETVEKFVEIDSHAPVMERIAKCESDNSHYDKSGQVLVRGNSTTDRKSVDVGIYQINMKYWGVKATELKYDLFNEQDNKKFAYWVYKNYGTEPWVHSKSCWNK